MKLGVFSMSGYNCGRVARKRLRSKGPAVFGFIDFLTKAKFFLGLVIIESISRL